MIFLCVKVGNKYQSKVVNSLYDQLKTYYSGNVDLYCLTDNADGLYKYITPLFINKNDTWKKLQWHKTSFFRENYNGITNGTEIIVCDIDIQILQNIDDLVDFPCNGFCGARRWWMLEYGQLSGTWYKFKAGKYANVDTKFSSYWQEYWVKNKLVAPPVNGEQNYVEMCIKDIQYFPDTWFTKWTNNDQRNYQLQYDFYKLSNEILYDGKYFHDDIKIVHYAGHSNINKEINLYA